MKLSAIRDINAADPVGTLGALLPRPVKEPAPHDPTTDNPHILRDIDGKLQTNITENYGRGSTKDYGGTPFDNWMPQASYFKNLYNKSVPEIEGRLTNYDFATNRWKKL